MEVKATPASGQNGTKQLLKQYGNQLICVRYRYDKARRERLKTIELIVDEQDWVPGAAFSVEKRVPVKIGFEETELREQMKRAGAYWNPDKKAWMLSCRSVLEMGLEGRIVDDIGLWFL